MGLYLLSAEVKRKLSCVLSILLRHKEGSVLSQMNPIHPAPILSHVYMVVFLFNTVMYVYVSSSCQLALFDYPDRFFRAFSSVVRQMAG